MSLTVGVHAITAIRTQATKGRDYLLERKGKIRSSMTWYSGFLQPVCVYILMHGSVTKA